MPVRRIGADGNQGAGRNAIAQRSVLSQRLAISDPDRQVEPQRLVDDLARVGQVRQLCHRGRPAAEDGRQLGAQPRCNVGVLVQQIEDPRQQPGRGSRARRRKS